MTTSPASAALRHTFRSMATDVTVQVLDPGPHASAAAAAAEQVFVDVAASCTRFDPASALMRANAAPRRWHQVPPELYAALQEASAAYVETDGAFDPRVLRTLESWGYDSTLPFRAGRVVLDAPATTWTSARRQRSRWRPRFDDARRAVRLGRDPVDLGGVGKGLAVRWAAAALAGAGRASLVEAGGDLFAAGDGPDGDGWRVGVEDPRGAREPVAVLRLQDAGAATSSVRVRRWRVAGREVHHIVDPRTGEPADSGLLSVTVVGPDPATAEVWSKALFVAGRGRVRQLADDRGIAALLVDTDGVIGLSRAMRPHVLWRVARA
jgi:thiamine biosynthesis lipoprotein